ncbi:MAG: serine hydrolase domain-containing protein, partial [Gemmataceae bacterium]
MIDPRKPLGLLLVLLAAAPAAAQPAVPPKYAAAVGELEKFIARELEQKRLPAISVALVDDQTVIWAKGFGFADAAKKVPATADTVYRVGSVSKLFTDLAIMKLVEEGKLKLDEPVTTYLPNFAPKNPSGKAITLRQLMTHHSGLCREPPVGSYFDP